MTLIGNINTILQEYCFTSVASTEKEKSNCLHAGNFYMLFSRFVQASMSKIQGLFKYFYKASPAVFKDYKLI